MDNPTTKLDRHLPSAFYGEKTNRTLFLRIGSDDVKSISNTYALSGV